MANKGNYYKGRTKEWFLERGYACDFVERYRRIFKDGTIIHLKQDLFGADGIAMNGREIIFWNSKFGTASDTEGIKEMLRFPYPSFVKRWIVHWQLRAREPKIIDVGEAVRI
jgi:hypothetical protein